MVDTAKIDAFFRSSPDPVWLSTNSGDCVYANPALERMTGLHSAQITRCDWESFLVESDRASVRASWQTALVTGNPFCARVRLQRIDGNLTTVDLTGYGHRLENGIELWLFTGLRRQIHNHEQLIEWPMPAELKRREAYLVEAQRLSRTGSFGWKPGDREIVWSDETYRIFEYSDTQKPSWQTVLERVHPDDRSVVQQIIEYASITGADFEHECRLLIPNGSIKHVHVRARSQHDDSGQIQFVGAITDITERKTTEEKIGQQEAALRQLLDFMPQLVVVFGPNHERLYANRAALEYRGLGLDEWREGITVHPDDYDRVRASADRTSSTPGPYDLQVRLRRADGGYRWFSAHYSPIHDDNGQIRYWYVALTDIDDSKRTERRLQQENLALREEIDHAAMFEEIVGSSPALRTVLSRVSRVAQTDTTVLISGETGTGKELIARGIHRKSKRAARAFVSVNCAAIPRDLFLSELFGHERGSFTGATHRRVGRFELADGGTIFLDEVSELSPETQVALLRVLQEREFERVGAAASIRIDVRVIAASNRDLKAAVASGHFRQDLFYRLNVFPIEVPPLRERKNDILLLVEYFVQRYAAKAGKNIRSIDKKTLEVLQSHDWPGNIRELQNVIERSVILTLGDVLSVDEIWGSSETSKPRLSAKVSDRSEQVGEPRTEREIIERVLAETRGRVSGPFGAAVKLGIPSTTLETRIKVLKIDKHRFKFLRA
jgi:formate hydrogenlyase transcriptional activator